MIERCADGATELSAAWPLWARLLRRSSASKAAMPSRGAARRSTARSSKIAWAFSLPGQWTAIDPNSVDFDPNTGELTLPWNVLGLPYNEVMVTYTAGLADDRRRCEDGMCADCAQCAVDAGSECQQDKDRHDADAVLLEFAGGRNCAGMAASLHREQAGVSDERYSAAQSRGSTADAGRCSAAQCFRNDGPATSHGHECRFEPVGNGLDRLQLFRDVVVSPVVMRKLRPTWQEGGESKWELLVSATSVQQQLSALDLASAQALFAMTLAVTVAGQDYLIESMRRTRLSGRCTYIGCCCAKRDSRACRKFTVRRIIGYRTAITLAG